MKSLATLGLAGLLGMAGCGKSEEPKRENYNARDGFAHSKAGIVMLVDEDGDGVVDYMTSFKDPKIVVTRAEGFTPKVPHIDWENSMTPKIRDLATQIRKAQQELRYQMDMKAYEDSQR